MTINISQKDVAAMRAYKKTVREMADHYGISVGDMRDILVQFGFSKPTKTSKTYTIALNWDFPNFPASDSESLDNIEFPVQDLVENESGELTAVNL